MAHQKSITNYFISKKPSASHVIDRIKNNHHEDKERKYTNDTIKDKDNELLKRFDLNWKFGPCSGISRLDRWERAAKHSLDPPLRVRKLILKNKNNLKYTSCIWDQNALLRPMGLNSCTST